MKPIGQQIIFVTGSTDGLGKQTAHTLAAQGATVLLHGRSPINFDDVMLERHYDPMRAYSQSKLALVMFTFDLAEALREEQITVNCLHPASLMNTKMVYEYFGYTLSTVQDGVDAVMYVATSPKLEGVTGKYFDQKQEAQANPQAYDREARRKLRQLSEALTGLQVAHEEKR
jgi:NAD(P)-dependent dehydrogenase (short-subunit alcohol dehydrogenase family)